ncbi:MAG: hypothetical protein VYB87_00415 [Acidobacteriota bacterium]|nr:hypothetical protein [Acidobacteriota bacterium]
MPTRRRLRKPRWQFQWIVRILTIVALTSHPTVAQHQIDSGDDVDLAGVWQAENYILMDGTEHPVVGKIFFAENDWSVLFFVLDESGVTRRGSGEGGTFTLTGDRLVLTHRYHLSAGEAMQGLPASELRMVAREPDSSAPEEPCQVVRNGNRLQLNFPSGNAMTFNRPTEVR